MFLLTITVGCWQQKGEAMEIDIGKLRQAAFALDEVAIHFEIDLLLNTIETLEADSEQ